jgi:hypothetical protein
MLIRDLMSRRLETISPMLPVRKDDVISGIITDRDIAVRAVAIGRDPEMTRVSEAMTPEVIYCNEEDEASEAVRRMATEQVRRLMVRDRGGRVVGVVSVDDLAASGETLGIAPNLVERLGLMRFASRRRGRAAWRLALVPLALVGIADAIVLGAAPRRWGRFWGGSIHRIAHRRNAARGFAALRGALSAGFLTWALRPLVSR